MTENYSDNLSKHFAHINVDNAVQLVVVHFTCKADGHFSKTWTKPFVLVVSCCNFYITFCSKVLNSVYFCNRDIVNNDVTN